MLNILGDLGDEIGSFATPPASTRSCGSRSAFAYMVVITGICLVASLDVVRYRPLLLVLAAGKTASSLAALGFYVFDPDVFIYLLNFLVDGFLVGAALFIWWLAGRVGEPAAPS